MLFHFSRPEKFSAVRLVPVLVFNALIFSSTLAAQNNLLTKEPCVSTHELSIPAKAQKEFTEGVKKLGKHDVQGSLHSLDKAIAIYPNYYEAYYDRGIVYSILKQYDEALESFQKSIDLSEGKYPRAEFGVGLVLTRKGQPVEAEAIIRHGLQAAPYLSDGYVILGVALLKQRRLEEAEKMARESLAMGDGGEGKGYLLLSDIHAGRGDYRTQAEDITAYLNLHPDDPDRNLLQAIRDKAKEIGARTQVAP